MNSNRKYSVARRLFVFASRTMRLAVVTGIAAALLASPAAAKHRRPFDVRIVPIFGGIPAVGGFMILTDPNEPSPARAALA